tara:strand:- start:1833 stop:2567 length:735 start_codon:yes stop_codon:yes gene_type:complete
MKLLFENWRKYLSESKAEINNELSEIAFNTMSAMSVFRDDGNLSEAEAADLQYLVSNAANPDPEVVDRFYDSLYGGKRSGFLSNYSRDEIARMDLYLLDGHNAGFAIKDGDDIVSVHNNSELRGLGSEFMRKAIEVGGARLDHFDGFLSGLYRKYGFTNVYEVYQWDEKYKPAKWNYAGVDIMSTQSSIYATALDDLVYEDPGALPNEEVGVEAESGLNIDINPKLKYNSYKYGRPDVIMRKLS